jgi:hypothetical protein
MAPKATAGKKAAKSRKPGGISIRCTPAWREWAEKGADHCRTSVSQAIDVALIDYYRSKGFNEPAPKR